MERRVGGREGGHGAQEGCKLRCKLPVQCKRAPRSSTLLAATPAPAIPPDFPNFPPCRSSPRPPPSSPSCQDKRELGCLVWPDEEALAAAPEAALGPQQLEERLMEEVARWGAGVEGGGAAGPRTAAALRPWPDRNRCPAGHHVVPRCSICRIPVRYATVHCAAWLVPTHRLPAPSPSAPNPSAAGPRRLNSSRPDYHPYDHIAHIAVVRTPLSAEDGTLTRTMKPRRPEIMRRHAAAAEGLMRRLRG